MSFDQRMLEMVFGEDSRGETPKERALTSKKRFVRGLFQIAEDSSKATGRRLSASEAFGAYGWDVLAEVAAEGYARLAPHPKAAGNALRQRITDLALSLSYVSDAASVPVPTVERMLASDPTLPLRFYESVAEVIGLDEKQIGVRSEALGNESLTVRLRTFSGESPLLTPFAVSAIAEAAWVAMTQARLESELGLRTNLQEIGFEPSPNYGGPGYPAYSHGYFLAGKARATLGIGEAPLPSLRELSEERLGIPIIQTNLGRRIAGLTVDTGTTRAVVVNLAEGNRTAFSRRVTVAHELGHLIYDPPERLNYLRVDDYDNLERPSDELRDPVEQRANAFAVELIAPQRSIVEVFKREGGASGGGLSTVMRVFGIGERAARYHIWNALERAIPLESIQYAPRLNFEDLQPWEALEAFTVDVHPLQRLRWSRRGRFSAVVIRAAEQNVISWDTAAHYLESNEAEVKAASESIRSCFPEVFR